MVTESSRNRVWWARYGDAVRCWGAFVIAPHLGGSLVTLLLTAFGLSDRMVLPESTTAELSVPPLGFVGGAVLGWWFLLRRDHRRAVGVDLDGADLDTGYWFPGRLVGGLAMIAAPVLLLAGELLRIRHYYYFPYQLRAADAHPTLMATSYGLYAAGLLLLWPAFVTLARLVGTRLPGWATWGGVLAVTGVCTRLFHEGVNYLSFQLVHDLGVHTAVDAVTASYANWYVFYPLVFTDNFAWTVLAIGAYRSGRLGWLPSFGLLIMMSHASGVLKGSNLGALLIDVGPCIAFIPLGVAVLDGASLTRRARVATVIVIVVLGGVYAYTWWNRP